MSELEDLKLKIGDEVEIFGCKGIVVESPTEGFVNVQCLEDADNNDPLYIKIGLDNFFNDGRHRRWHKTPSLKVIKRKEVKQIRRFFGHISPFGCPVYLCDHRYPNGGRCDSSDLIKTSKYVDLEVEW